MVSPFFFPSFSTKNESFIDPVHVSVSKPAPEFRSLMLEVVWRLDTNTQNMVSPFFFPSFSTNNESFIVPVHVFVSKAAPEFRSLNL